MEGEGQGGGAAPAADPAAGQAPSSLLGGAGREPEGQGQGEGQAQGGNVVTDPWYKGWIKSDGTLDHSRLAHAPDEIKGSEKLRLYKSIEDLPRGLAHLEKLIGKKGLMPLPENASEADKAEFDKRLRAAVGAPEAPEGYGLDKRPEQYPEEMWDPARASQIAEILHKHKAPPGLAAELIENDRQWAAQALESAKTEQQRQEQERFQGDEARLKAAWGVSFDQNAKLAIRGAKHFGIDPDSALFLENADVIMAMAKAARHVSESDFVDAAASSGAGGSDPKAELDAMMGDRSHRYYAALRDQNHPQFALADAHLNRLIEAMSKKGKG